MCCGAASGAVTAVAGTPTYRGRRQGRAAHQCRSWAWRRWLQGQGRHECKFADWGACVQAAARHCPACHYNATGMQGRHAHSGVSPLCRGPVPSRAPFPAGHARGGMREMLTGGRCWNCGWAAVHNSQLCHPRQCPLAKAGARSHSLVAGGTAAPAHTTHQRLGPSGHPCCPRAGVRWLQGWDRERSPPSGTSLSVCACRPPRTAKGGAQQRQHAHTHRCGGVPCRLQGREIGAE